jgi:putative ubiquitin-RnfH superfamily antitoxin RatB of RatAB toxin-antitoxin module
MQVKQGTTARELVLDAVALSQIDLEEEWSDPMRAPLGVYSQLVDDDYELAHGDRLEIYRPLQQDPKELRRQRARQSDN